MEQQWPEGPHADAEAARERYDSDMQASRHALREHFRVDVRLAHAGLAIVVVVSALVGVVRSPLWGLVVAGGFAALFVVALGVALATGKAGRDAVRAAYKAAFGFPGWV